MERQQIVTVEEEDDLVLDSLLAANCSIERDVEPIEPRDHAADRTVPSQKRGALAAQRSAPLIVCAEEDSSGSGRCGGLYPPTYVTPAPHRPGDHLRRSMNGAEVPPRSILRKTSSYASFPEAGEKASPAGRKSRRPSFLSMKSSSSLNSRGSASSSRGASVGLNLDLEDSLLRHYPRAPIRRSESQPDLVKGGASKGGGGHPMRSRVSFNSVDVRCVSMIRGSCVPMLLSYHRARSHLLHHFELFSRLSKVLRPLRRRQPQLPLGRSHQPRLVVLQVVLSEHRRIRIGALLEP